MKRFSLLLLPAAALAGIAPAHARPQSMQRAFPARGFDKVLVQGCDRVTITTGPTFSVSASGEAKVLDSIRISVRGGELRLDRAPRSCNGNNVPTALITVAMPELHQVKSTGTGDVDIDRVSGGAFEGQLTGTGDLKIGQLRAGKAELSLSGTGDIMLGTVAADALTLDLSGTGDIGARGTADTLSIRDSGTGDVDTRELQVRLLDIHASGTGAIKARASETANVANSGPGSVTVLGHPRCSLRNSGPAHIVCG